jgi:hypothetical protein
MIMCCPYYFYKTTMLNNFRTKNESKKTIFTKYKTNLISTKCPSLKKIYYPRDRACNKTKKNTVFFHANIEVI